MNTNHKFSVSPVWAERIERGAELLCAVVACSVWVMTAIVLTHLVAMSWGLV
jgi:hypothetical protein